MRTRKINKTHIATATVLSAAFLFAACGIGPAKEAQPESPAVEEESSNNQRLTEEEGKAENQGQDIADENNAAAGNKAAAESDGVTENNITAENNGVTENNITAENGGVTENDIATGNEAADQQEASSASTALYDDVLAEYSDMVQHHFYMDLLESDAYEDSFGEHIGLEIRTHERSVYYAFYDLDKNGTMELVIAADEGDVGVSNPSFSPWNYDLYGYDGAGVVHLFPDMDFGYRTNCKLCENGVIEVSYSGGAAETGLDFYKIGGDGFTPELIDSFAAVAHLEGDEPVFTHFQGGNEISEEEYHTRIQSYTVPLTLDWRQIQ